MPRFKITLRVYDTVFAVTVDAVLPHSLCPLTMCELCYWSDDVSDATCLCDKKKDAEAAASAATTLPFDADKFM